MHLFSGKFYSWKIGNFRPILIGCWMTNDMYPKKNLTSWLHVLVKYHDQNSFKIYPFLLGRKWNFGEEMGSPATYFHQTQMVEPPSTNPSSQERRNMQSGDFEAAGLGVDQRYGGKIGSFFSRFYCDNWSSFVEKYLGGQVFGFKATFRFSWFLFRLLALKDWKEEMIQFHHLFLWLASHKKQLFHLYYR